MARTSGTVRSDHVGEFCRFFLTRRSNNSAGNLSLVLNEIYELCASLDLHTVLGQVLPKERFELGLAHASGLDLDIDMRIL